MIMAEYKVKSIGAAFNQKAIDALGASFTTSSQNGWEFHSVFSIEKKGCMGTSEGTTYLAVFKKD